MKKIILAFLIIFGIGIFIWYFFFFENVVVKGDAYGFSIGMNKPETINVIKKRYNSEDNQIILSHGSRHDDVKNIKYLKINELTNDIVKEMDVWQLRINGKETNVLVFFYNDSKLIKMMRYRRAFIP